MPMSNMAKPKRNQVERPFACLQNGPTMMSEPLPGGFSRRGLEKFAADERRKSELLLAAQLQRA